MLRHMRQTSLVIRPWAWDKCRSTRQNILGQCLVLLLGLLLLSSPASATSASWSETLDIAVSMASARVPVMLCIVDTAGQAQCHHQEGILTCRQGVADGAVCPGGAKRLLSSCQDASQCVFGAVPVPPDAFGLLLLELHPPLFEVPRHRVVEGVILSASSMEVSPTEHARLQGALHALGRGLAPTTPQTQEPFPGIVRTTCVDRPCQFARSTIQLTPRTSKIEAATQPSR
jgi:hypothetical protein